VSNDGRGNYGLVFSPRRQDPMTLTRQALETLGDEFDFVVVFTTFADVGTGAIAYYVGVRANERGIGVERQDDGPLWGSPRGGRLQGFVNMGTAEQYPGLDGLPITDPDSFAVGTLGQELSHRWLAFMLFRDASGRTSDAMLGRDAAHWSAALDADASVQDGNDWRDNGDGTFTLLEQFARYSELDLYGMGLLAPDEVDPFFLIDGATWRGRRIDPAARLPDGITITGRRVDITVDDVIAAMGVREPGHEESSREFRAAFLLVTRPGERAETARRKAAEVDAYRAAFETRFRAWTRGTAVLCTRIDARCDLPAPRVGEFTVSDAAPGGDGDGVVEPGETVGVRVQFVNGGTAAAGSVVGKLTSGAPDRAEVVVGEQAYPELAPGAAAWPTGEGFVVRIPASATCGGDLSFQVEATADGERVGGGVVTVALGVVEIARERFDARPAGWRVDPGRDDTATEGGWEWTDFAESVGQSRDTDVQPIRDHTAGEGGGALVTGPATGRNVVYEDLDGGRSVIEGPAMDLASALDPILAFWVWQVAVVFDRETGALVTPPGEELVVQLSNDGGATWKEAMRDGQSLRRWREVRVRVRDHVEPTSDVRLRLLITDDGEDSMVEAAIDDLAVLDVTAQCPGVTVPPGDDGDGGDDGGGDGEPGGGGGGCGAAPGHDGGMMTALYAMLAGALLWRRRARRRGAWLASRHE
jgi:hypothetical protein